MPLLVVMAGVLAISCGEPKRKSTVEMGTGAVVLEHQAILDRDTPLPEGFQVLGITLAEAGMRYSVQLAWSDGGGSDGKDYIGVDVDLYGRPELPPRESLRQGGLIYQQELKKARKQSGRPVETLDDIGDFAFQVRGKPPRVVLLRGNAVIGISGEDRLVVLRTLARALDARILAAQKAAERKDVQATRYEPNDPETTP